MPCQEVFALAIPGLSLFVIRDNVSHGAWLKVTGAVSLGPGIRLILRPRVASIFTFNLPRRLTISSRWARYTSLGVTPAGAGPSASWWRSELDHAHKARDLGLELALRFAHDQPHWFLAGGVSVLDASSQHSDTTVRNGKQAIIKLAEQARETATQETALFRRLGPIRYDVQAEARNDHYRGVQSDSGA